MGLTISLAIITKLERITAEVLEQPMAELAEAVKTAEPTNNEAERAQRGAVIWRRIIGLIDSDEGS